MKFFSALALATLRTAVVLSILSITACSTATTAPSGVVARVNGLYITAAELEEQYTMNIQGVDPLPDEEEADDLKLQLLNEMITNQILMQLADERGLIATDAEVDVRFNEFKNQYSNERFQELLDEQQITADDMRDELRNSLAIEKLVNMEITSKISVAEADIEDFFNRHKASFDLPETFYISHILVTDFEDPGLNNLEGDDAKTLEEARAKAAGLLLEIQGGQDFGTMARRYSEDPSTAPNGGDLGFLPIEIIAGLDPGLADVVIQMRIGETFPNVIETSIGYHIIKLIDRDEGGQKDVSDPEVESQIHQIIFSRRDQLMRGAFYERARNASNIQNFFAERILERSF